MFKKAIALYLAVFLIAAVISGCMNCKCNPQSFHFKWKSLDLSSASYTINSGHVYPEDYSGNDFWGKNFMLRVRLNGELVAANCPSRPGFVNQAYACSCVEDSYESNSVVSDLKVFTVNPYDSVHAADAEVTEYFKSPHFAFEGADGLGPLDLQLSAKNRYFWEAGTNYELYLETKPTYTGKHQFKVIVYFSDSSSYTATTPELMF